MTAAVTPCKRPKVTVDERADRGTFDVNCHVPGCSWTYPTDKQFMALKSDAEDQATRHRGEHRAVVPKSEIIGPTVSLNYAAKCACGWRSADGCITRVDNEAALAYHLSTDHGLVVCR